MRHHPLRKIAAWGVHGFTACGAGCGLVAIHHCSVDEFKLSFLWIFIAVLIDACDGTLARWVSVRQVLPEIDGSLMDNIVDFLNYVIAPMFLLSRANLLPEALSVILPCLIATLSCFQFSRADAKTPDHFFRGFPCYWNVLVFYQFVFQFSKMTNLYLLVFCTILLFVPLKYVYPTRTERFKVFNILSCWIWGGSLLVLWWQLPSPSAIVFAISLLYPAYYLSLSLWLNCKRPATATS